MDNTREKMIELVFSSLCKHVHKSCKLAENITDDLISNGVTFAKDTNVLTNADRIRAMSDEELAEFLSKADFYCKGNCKKCLRGTACIPMLQWLKQPAEVPKGD